MGLDPMTAVRWGSVDQVMDKLSARNKRLRIINDSLYIKAGGNDPLHCWDGEAREFVYVRKHDWLRSSPAIRTTEACIIMRITPAWFKRRRDELGIVPKKAVLGKIEGVPQQAPQVYYTINDLIEISRTIGSGPRNPDPASEHEIRKLFAQGYTTYKKTKDGEFIPVWDESIY